MKRHAIRHHSEPVHLKLTVAAAAVVVSRTAAHDPFSASGGRTKVRIEGTAAGPDQGLVRNTLLLVAADSVLNKGIGNALGGKTPWTVVCELPRDQFADLVSMVLMDRLQSVEMTFEALRWHKGTLLSVTFGTAPLPSESD